MTARHWMQIAALTSALGLTGAAIAQDTNATTTTDSSSLSSYWMDTPSSGAIVTPADKAAGMGKGDDQASARNGDVDEGPLSMGQDAGLIRDIPGAGEVVSRIAREADEIVTQRLSRLVIPAR